MPTTQTLLPNGTRSGASYRWDDFDGQWAEIVAE